ncbi:MAG: transglutaminase family protein [Caldilineaceae bacterium]|nr:transglutaminase family protein [Caldilineaceae bacterium]
MHYAIRHVTRFQYTAPIAESITEVRMHPRQTLYQQCDAFQLQVRPQAAVFTYEDHLHNVVHHFSQPAVHQQLAIIAQAEVQVSPRPALPPLLPDTAWSQIDAVAATGEHWDMLAPSEFTTRTERLDALAQELDVRRRDDPLRLLLELNHSIHRTFAYDAASTRVDSPIDEALAHRRGVCQDFAHIMIALVRNYLAIPCRYVSGYLYHRRDDRSADGASHAWLDAWLPEIGWVGFDPTNNVLVGERHIEVAVGRDYHDVPPTRGVFKGLAGSELTVSVRVRAVEDGEHMPADTEVMEMPPYRSMAEQLHARYAETLRAMQLLQQQQQQQQQ